jgi:hypothetical protein
LLLELVVPVVLHLLHWLMVVMAELALLVLLYMQVVALEVEVEWRQTKVELEE